MPLIKKRRLKIRWRILFLVLPFTIIPLILIILFIRYSLFSYMEDQKLILNDALLYQIAQNVEEKYNEDSKKIIRLLDIPEIKDNIFKRAFVSKKEEEQISDWVNKGYDGKNTGLNNRVNELSIKGLVYIINRDRYSIKRDQPYSYWKTSKVSWDIKTDEMIKNPILKIAEQNIFINKHGVKSAKLLYFYPKSILPLFVFDPYENKKWYSLLFPIVNNTSSSGDRDSKYFEAFALIIQKNIVFEELFPKVIKDDILKGQSTIYILDYKNESIYSNVRTKNLEVKVSVDNTVLDNRNLQNILNDNYDKYKIGPNKTKVFDFKHKNSSYQTFILDTNKITNMRSGIKFLYFYPKEIIYMPIYRILFRILIISFIIFIFVIIISVIISNSLSYPLIKLDYATNKVSQGYLDIDIISESRDEIGHLYRNFRRMINSHINVLANIQRSSNDLTGYQNSLDKVINNFDGTLKKQAMSISKSLAIFKELDSSIIKVVQNVKNAQGIIKQSQVYSDNSNVIINDMMNEIKRIARTSQEINSITNLINKISEKTRLLSLNAAIEASSAGEAGKGFGVVATEIRKLASQSNEAANQITELIKINYKRIKSGVSKTTGVITALKNINSSIKMITNIIAQISIATQEETKDNKIIMDIINSFSDDAKENLESMDALGRIKNLLNMEVEKMRNIVNAFILRSDKREVIRDIKIVTKEDKEKLKNKKKKHKIEQMELRKEIEEKKRINKMRVNRSNKLDTVRAISLYKPKRSIFGLFGRK